jgi:plasmid stability protein
MAAVLIRDVPAETLAALRERAKRNARSLQGELRDLLINVARQDLVTKPLEPIRLTFSTVTPLGENWSREEIYRDDDR